MHSMHRFLVFFSLSSLLTTWAFSSFSAPAKSKIYHITKTNFGSVEIQEYFDVAWLPEAEPQELLQPPPESAFEEISPTTLKKMNRGVSWFRLQLENATEETVRVSLQTSQFFFPFSGVIDHRGSLVQLQDSPLNSELITDRYLGGISYELAFAPKEQKTIYLRLHREWPRPTIGFRLLDQQATNKERVIENGLKGFLMGTNAIMGFCSLFLFLHLRKKTYLYYCLYLLFYTIAFSFGKLALFTLSDALWVRQYQPYLAHIVTELALLFASLYVIHYLSLKTEDRSIYRLTRIYPFICIFNIFLVFWNTSLAYQLSSLFSLFFAPLFLIAGIRAYRRGEPTAIYFCIGWTILICGYFIYALNILQLISPRPYFGWILYFSGSAEMLFLLIALASKFSEDQVKAYQKIGTLNHSLRQTNQELRQSLRQAEIATASRISMVSELAHRANNPLGRMHLALEEENYVRKELQILLNGIFEGVNSPEAQSCYESIQDFLRSMGQQEQMLRANLKHIGEAIQEIRILSGADGWRMENCLVSHCLQGALDRLKDNMLDQDFKRLHLQKDLDKNLMLWTCEKALLVSFHHIIKSILESSKEEIYLSIDSNSSTHEQMIYLEFETYVAVTLFKNPKFRQGIEELIYLISPFQIHIFFQESESRMTLLLGQNEALAVSSPKGIIAA